MSLNSKSEISSLWLSSMTVQPGLCLILLETMEMSFLATGLIP